MKVITKIIADIDDAIDEHGEDIIRIELTNSEFISLLKSGLKFEATSLVEQDISNYSGSYVVYRGVCIQTHRSYYDCRMY